jgi:hypothetical protein
VTVRFEIVGGAGPRETAAIMAALARAFEEQVRAEAEPPMRPTQGKWVLSGRPRPVAGPLTTRPTPAAEGWSVGSPDEYPEPL